MENKKTAKCNPATHEFIGNKCLMKCKDGKTRNANNRCVNIPREKQTKEKKQKCDERTHEFIGNKCLMKCKDGKTRNANNRCVNIPREKQNTDQLLLPTHDKIATELETTDYFQFMEDLKQVGETYIETGIEYPNNNRLIDGFMLSYLINKYKNASKCLVLQDNQFVFRFYSTMFEPHTEKERKYFQEIYKVFVKQILHCLKKNKNNDNHILLIPISLMSDYGHLNFLIYRSSTSTLEQFEPHGTVSVLDKELNKLSKNMSKFFFDIVQKMNALNDKHNQQYFNNPITYIEPKKMCPSLLGFQRLELNSVYKFHLNHPEVGFCRMWCFFFAELVLMNPTIESEQLLTTILKWMKEENNFKHIKSVIRGYIHMMYERIENMLKKHDPSMTMQKFHAKNKPKIDANKISKIANKYFVDIDKDYYNHTHDKKTYNIHSISIPLNAELINSY
jgi:hypothetical protein